MKSLNRTLSLVLVLVMVLGLFGVAGATFKDDAKITNEKAVQTCSALNIINGKDDGNFDPEGIVTRGEMAKMICVALNGGVEPTLGTLAAPTYTDIKGQWAEKYIEYCAGLAIVAGKGDGTFAPTATVTGTEAAKMLLVALGYNSEYESFVGADWSVKVNTVAMAKGLYADLAIDASAGLTRDNAAQMVYNALYAEMVKYTYGIAPGTSGSVTGVAQAYDTGDTMLKARYKLVEESGRLGKITYNDVDKTYTYTLFTVNATDKITGTPVDSYTTAVDYSDFFGMDVTVFWKDKVSTANPTFSSKDDTVYNMVADGSQIIAKGNNGLMAKYDAAKETLTFGLTKQKVEDGNVGDVFTGYTGAKVANGAIHYMTEGASYISTTGGAAATATADLTFIDNDGDNKIDTIVVIPFTVAKVTSVGTSKVSFDGISSKVIDDNAIYTGIAKDDVVRYYAASSVPEDIGTITKENVITGTVSGSKGAAAYGTYQFQVNGIFMTSTNVDTFLVKGAIEYPLVEKLPQVGDTIEYVAVGAVAPYVKVTDVGATSKNVAFVGNTDKILSGLDVGTYKAALTFTDGTSKNVKVSKIANADTNDTNFATIKGNLVTYKVNSSDEYELTLVASGNKAGHDGVGTSDKYKDKKVGGYTLADDAVVFFYTSEAPANGVKVYTGKEMKNTLGVAATGAFDSTEGAGDGVLANADGDACLYDEVNGFNYAKIAVIKADERPAAVTGKGNYGYLVDDAYRNTDAEGTTYLNYKIWNGTETISVKEKSTDEAYNYTKGSVVVYDIVDATTIKNVDVTSMTVTAVTGWNTDKTTGDITFKNGVSSEITSDTVILYVDTETHTGEESTGIRRWNGTNNNVAYINDNDGNVVVIVVDVNQNIDVNYQILPKTAVMADLTDVWADYDEVVIDDDFAPAYAISIPAGKTLTVTGDFTPADNITLASTADIVVTGTRVVAAGKTWTFNDVMKGSWLETVTGGTGSKLDIKVASSSTSDKAVTSAIGADLKFWATAGVSGTTDGTTAVTSGIIAADVYVWGTAYYGGSGASTAANVWVAE